MKGTTQFKETIHKYLQNKALNDSLFAQSFAKEGKTIDDCITYILNQVKASGCCGFADEEIYSMAVHYYDEDDIKVGKPLSCNVVVNHSIAKEDVCTAPVRSSSKRVKKAEVQPMPSLFD